MFRHNLTTREGSARCLGIIAVSLAVALLLTKAWFLHAPRALTLAAGWTYVRSLAAVSYADALFAAGFWLVARLSLAVTARWPRAGRVVVLTALGLAAFTCVYAVANVVIFSFLGGFLTYPLLALIGNVRMLSSSLAATLTVPVVLGISGVPLAYLGSVWLMARRPAPNGRRRLRGAAAAGALVAWTIVGHQVFTTSWEHRAEWRIAENAPWVLASSWWSSVDEGGNVRLSDVFPASHLDDFLRLGERARRAVPAAVRRVAALGRRRTTVVSRRPPNVIFIVLESVAARWTSLPGGAAYDTTPRLKAALDHSLAFENFYAHTGRSSSSLYAMLLSAYPKIDFRDITEEYPRATGTSLASLFRTHGYATAMVTSSDLAWAGWGDFLGTRGFDELRDYHDLRCTDPLSSWGVEDRCMVDAMLDYVDHAGQRPFFLMGWTQQTHHPYEPTPGVPLLNLVREPFADDYDVGRYLNVLRETDRHLGRLFDGIEHAGLADDTLVVIVGDHGQAFGYPHNTWMQGRTLYQEDVQVPLMLWYPRLYRAPVRSKQIGSQVDLAPSIAQLVGLPPAPDWQGHSLFDAAPAQRAYFYVADDHFALGVREGDWKYIVDVRDGTEELYNLARDPSEQQNIAKADPDRCRILRQRLAAFAEANRRQYES